MKKLIDYTRILRSKNAGPLFITFDLIFYNYEDMNYVFEDAQSFNQPLENWNVSNVESMGGMFSGAKSFNQPLDKWNVSKVTYMRGMFEGASAFSHYPQSWVVPKDYSYDMFKGTPLEQLAKEQPLKTEERE